MSELYDPQMEEEDQGYSIPKILVAVLLLILIGAGTYIFLQQRKISNTVRLLTEQKNQVDKELAEMIEMYNLAKDDNSNLSKELSEDRDRLIRFQDSMKKVQFIDKKSVEEYDKALKKLRETSKFDFETAAQQEKTNTISNTPSSTNSLSDNLTTTTANTPSTIEVKEPSTKTNETVKPTANTESPTTDAEVARSETPATFPGCSGTTAQKTDCFKKKVASSLAAKFNTGVVESLNLSSGTHRVSVAFTVDKFGNVVNIKAKGPNGRSEQEAVKAAKTLPKMIPARQNGVPVDVNFIVPLTLKVE